MRKKYKIFLDKIIEEDRLLREASHSVEIPNWQKASTFIERRKKRKEKEK